MAHAAADTPASHREVPKDFICPITQEIMTDPVTTVSFFLCMASAWL